MNQCSTEGGGGGEFNTFYEERCTNISVPASSRMTNITGELLHFPRRKVHLSDMTAVSTALAGAQMMTDVPSSVCRVDRLRISSSWMLFFVTKKNTYFYIQSLRQITSALSV